MAPDWQIYDQNGNPTRTKATRLVHAAGGRRGSKRPIPIGRSREIRLQPTPSRPRRCVISRCGLPDTIARRWFRSTALS